MVFVQGFFPPICVQLARNLGSPCPAHQVLAGLQRATTGSLKEHFHPGSLTFVEPLFVG